MRIELITLWLRRALACHALGICGTLSCVAVTQAADFTGYLVLTSDYVYRGLTYSDGHVAAQLGGDVTLASGLYAGVWASTIDIAVSPSRQRDRQVNYYVGYGYDLDSNWTLGGSIVAFTFPGATGSFEYDYEEFSLSANYRDRAWLEYSYSPDYYDSGRSTHNIDLFAEWPLAWQLMLGAGIGHYDVSDFAGEGYSYWQLGLTRPFGRIDIDLRYHDTDQAVPIVSYPDRAGARFSVSARFLFQ
jgi:uncharacterized protein (TIGR02001 family)